MTLNFPLYYKVVSALVDVDTTGLPKNSVEAWLKKPETLNLIDFIKQTHNFCYITGNHKVFDWHYWKKELKLHPDMVLVFETFRKLELERLANPVVEIPSLDEVPDGYHPVHPGLLKYNKEAIALVLENGKLPPEVLIAADDREFLREFDAFFNTPEKARWVWEMKKQKIKPWETDLNTNAKWCHPDLAAAFLDEVKLDSELDLDSDSDSDSDSGSGSVLVSTPDPDPTPSPEGSSEELPEEPPEKTTLLESTLEPSAEPEESVITPFFPEVPDHYHPVSEEYLSEKVQVLRDHIKNGKLTKAAIATDSTFRRKFKAIVRDSHRELLNELIQAGEKPYITGGKTLWCHPRLAKAFQNPMPQKDEPSDTDTSVISGELQPIEEQSDNSDTPEPPEDEVIEAEVVDCQDTKRLKEIGAFYAEKRLEREYNKDHSAGLLPKSGNFPLIPVTNQPLFSDYACSPEGCQQIRRTAMFEHVTISAVLVGSLKEGFSIHPAIATYFAEWTAEEFQAKDPNSIRPLLAAGQSPEPGTEEIEAVTESVKVQYIDIEDILGDHKDISRELLCDYSVTKEGRKLQLDIAGTDGIRPEEVLLCTRKNDGFREQFANWDNVLSPGYTVQLHPTFCDHFVEWVKQQLTQPQPTEQFSTIQNIRQDYRLLREYLPDPCFNVPEFVGFMSSSEGLDCEREIADSEGIDIGEVIQFLPNGSGESTNDGTLFSKIYDQTLDVYVHPVLCDHFLEWVNTPKNPPTFEEVEERDTMLAKARKDGEKLAEKDIQDVISKSDSTRKYLEDLISGNSDEDGVLVPDHYFVSLKQLREIVQDKVKELGSAAVVTVRAINLTLAEWKYQRREGNKWKVLPDGSKFRRGNQWDVAIVDDLAKELSVVYLTTKELQGKVKNALALESVTPNMISSGLAKLGYQTRGESDKGYKTWFPSDTAIATKKCKKKGGRLVWHPDVVDDLVANPLFFTKPGKAKKITKSRGENNILAAIALSLLVNLVGCPEAPQMAVEPLVEIKVSAKPTIPPDIPSHYIPLIPNYLDKVRSDINSEVTLTSDKKLENIFTRWLECPQSKFIFEAIAHQMGVSLNQAYTDCIIKDNSGIWWLHPGVMRPFKLWAAPSLWNDSSTGVQVSSGRKLKPWAKDDTLPFISSFDLDPENFEYLDGYVFEELPVRLYGHLLGDWLNDNFEGNLEKIVEQYPSKLQWRDDEDPDGKPTISNCVSRFGCGLDRYQKYERTEILPPFLKDFSEWCDVAILRVETSPVDKEIFARTREKLDDGEPFPIRDWLAFDKENSAMPQDFEENENRFSFTIDEGGEYVWLTDYNLKYYKWWKEEQVSPEKEAEPAPKVRVTTTLDPNWVKAKTYVEETGKENLEWEILTCD
ncbi:hypothetical protein [Moorena sp. SIO3A5]|uniref:hypothetical protein n=1 Tax=Moorena sp. SIO3A5 TaxID=2607822 RepID=UPI00141C7455|nr:hypothetical protein [Moorena sp. SIO3A5]NEP69002.1 hypothetical protein [Moorena sp. SIO3A5]